MTVEQRIAVEHLLAARHQTGDESQALHASISTGQSLSVWSNSGGLKGQAWTAQLHWGRKVSPHLKMFNGGMLQPGVSGDRPVNPAHQATLIDAIDALYNSTPQYDADGNATGKTAYTACSSPAIAAMIRRALGSDGNNSAADRFFATIGIGNRSITHFLPAGEGSTSRWYANVFSKTVEHLVTAASDYEGGVIIDEIPFEQGEFDTQTMTKAVYRNHLDHLVEAYTETVPGRTGQSVAPIVAQTQIGSTLLTNGAALIGRPLFETTDVALAILEKGISLDSTDANYICVGPRYDLTFAGFSHLTDVGYLHNDERRAYVLNEDRRIRSGAVPGQSKWLPVHCKSADLHIIGGRQFLALAFHVPFSPLCLDTELVAKKAGYGFTLYGGSNKPDIIDCQIIGGDTVLLELNAIWNGEGRSVGIATKASTGRQGWLTDNGAPYGVWKHVGMGCNIRDSAPWTSIATGQPLPNWPCSQYVPIAD